MLISNKSTVPEFWCLACAVVLGTCLASGTEPNNSTKVCDHNRSEFCSNRLFMLGDRTFHFPVNLKQMNKRCKEVKQVENCVKDYAAKCLPVASKPTISIMTYGVARANRVYCQNQKRKMAFISFGPCLNLVKKNLDNIVDKIVVEMHAVAEYRDSKMKIPMACCIYHQFREKTTEQLNRRCGPEADEFESLLDSYSQDGLNSACGSYLDESDKCDKVIAMIPAYKGKLRSTSFIHPMADIFANID